jgi:DNA-binding MarR family transcriptional regulator
VTKREIIAAISAALADLQAAYDDRDRALASVLGVGRTDLRCLDLITRSGPQTASQLGRQLNLTRGSMTTLIDRLEKAGYAKRYADPEHGKRKLVAPTPKLVQAIEPAIQARHDEGSHRLQSKSATELNLILDFLRSTVAQQASARDANSLSRRRLVSG